MKANIKNLPKSEIEIEIEVPVEDFKPYFDKALELLGKDVEAEGFRKGKAPKKIVEEKLGESKILIEAAEMAIGDFYKKAVLENDIEPIASPEVEIVKLGRNNPLVFKAKTAVLPKVDLPDYKSLAKEVKKGDVKVEEKEIEESLNWLKKTRAKMSQKSGPAEKGDFVEVNYKSKDVEEISPEGQMDKFILGEGGFVKGFEDNILGMNPGEEKEFSVKFPEDYNSKKLAGKDVRFNLKLTNVQKIELPELNDEFAKGLGGFENMEALKKSVKEGITLEKEQVETQRVRAEILEKIADKSKVDIPDILVRREQENIFHDFMHRVEDGLKMPFEEYLKKTSKTEKEILDSLANEAVKKVKVYLVLREIGIKENIEPKDEELRQEEEKILQQFPSPEEAMKKLDPNRLKEYARGIVINEKIFKMLESLAK